MQAGYNTVLVTIEKQFNDTLIAPGGMEFYLDPSYQPEKHSTIVGTVVAVPVFKNLKGHWDIKVGDKLYFNYLVVLTPENRIDQYWSVDAMLCIARVRAGELKPVGNYILLRPIIEVTEKIGSIIVPIASQKKRLDKGTVVATNMKGTEIGDVVVFSKIGKFENEIEGEILYCAYEKNLFLKEKHVKRKRNSGTAGGKV